MEYNKRMAFPKLIYDKTKLAKGWSNDVTKAVAVNGNPRDAVFDVFSAAPVNQQALELIESTITKTVWVYMMLHWATPSQTILLQL